MNNHIMKASKTIAMLVLLVSFMACKKDNSALEETKEPFDIRQYVLLRTSTDNSNWIIDVSLTSFDAQSKSIVFNEGGRIPDNGFTYSYADGVLKLLYDGRVNTELKIENNTIASKTTNGITASYQLIKIPTENQLNGNTYNGAWKSKGSLISYVASVKFTDTHFSEASINLPVPNKPYELFKNIAAYHYDATNKIKTLWIFTNGKLEGYRNNYGGEHSRSTGTFSK